MPLAKRAASPAKRAATLTLLAAWLACLAGLLPAVALAEAYTVRGIEVDVEAENAVMAQEQAILRAEREGLRRLLERLTLPQYYGQLPAVGDEALGRLVSAYEVEDESVSATRYVGRLSVVYDETAVQGLLEGTGVPIVVEAPPALLVVPALDQDGGLAVFTGPGGWRDAWAAETPGNTLFDIRLPLGDLTDLQLLSGDAIARNPEEALALAAERHGAESAILLIARADDPLSPTRVTVANGGSHALGVDFAGDSLTMDGDAESVWRAAARRVMAALENDWKAQNLIAMDRLAQLRVGVPLGTLDEWADIRRRLDQVAAIRRIDVASFAQAEAELVLNHVGSVSQLQRVLDARGLRLTEGAGAWQLQRAAGQPAG
jgi:hypothetical protein